MTPWEVDIGVVLEIVRASHRCVLEVQRQQFELPDDIQSLDDVQARFIMFGLGEYLANRGPDDMWDEPAWMTAGDTITGFIHNRDNWQQILAARDPITVTFHDGTSFDPHTINGLSRANGHDHE